MPMIPWMQQVRGARFGEEPPIEPPRKPGVGPAPPEITGVKPPREEEKSWWERKMGPEGWTWPWEEAHWDRPGAEAAKWALGIGLGAGGAALGLGVAPALAGLSGLPGMAGLTGPALTAMSHPWLMGMGGLGAGLMAPGFFPTEGTEVAPGPAGLPPTGPPEAPGPTEPPILPQPGEAGEAAQPTFFTDEQGQRWVYNEYTGAWTMVQPPREPTLTPEQQIGLSEEERAHQMAMLQEQYRLEQQAMTQQAGASREQQAAAAAQQMAQMYAADPYKYWAQMGQGTPGAVARLTGGQVAAGGQMRGEVPLSVPSAQWWQNLLPSEQQQISGGLNWMGVDPADWYSMYQRQIPGLGSRQMGPAWAR